MTDVSIGTTLSRARETAGLSVAEVSARTRIRTPLIRAIEADDFGPCGGDFYARGHIRAIARIVGVDSRPLIDAYDGLAPEQRASEAAGLDDLFLPEADADPGTEPAVAAAAGPATAPQPAAADEPTPRGKSRRKGAALVPLAVLAGVALAVIGTGAYQLASNSSSRSAAVAAAGTRPSAHPTTAPVRQSATATAPASPSSTPSPRSSSPKPSPSPKKVTLTHVAPSGASADDNPGEASKALAGDYGDPWHTEWYTSPEFGNLKSGTGLTLTLPRRVTATGVTVKFADSGGSMEVKAGSSPGSLHTVASGSAGGTQTLSFSKTSARYIELWFTKLGTTSGGSNQIAVYDVSVSAQKSS